MAPGDSGVMKLIGMIGIIIYKVIYIYMIKCVYIYMYIYIYINI